jgi:hypothetical protein
VATYLLEVTIATMCQEVEEGKKGFVPGEREGKENPGRLGI